MNSTNSSFVDLIPAWEWWRDASLLGWCATGTERERMAFALASAALLLVAIVMTVCFVLSFFHASLAFPLRFLDFLVVLRSNKGNSTASIAPRSFFLYLEMA